MDLEKVMANRDRWQEREREGEKEKERVSKESIFSAWHDDDDDDDGHRGYVKVQHYLYSCDL